MNRRSFFARTAGAFVAAMAISLKAPEHVTEWRANHGPEALTFKGIPLTFDAHASGNAIYVFNDTRIWKLTPSL